MKPGGYRYSLDTNLGIVLAGILVTALLATVVLAQLSESVWRHQATNADLLLDQVARMAEEGNSTINDLNRQNREGCDSTLLSELRRRLFFADHLRDIGYVRNGALVCSAVRGVLSNPIRMDSPDYQSFRGFKVWAREQFELFNRTIEATLAAKGNFMVIYDVSSVFSLFSTPYHWQLVYQHDGRLAPVLGEQGVFRADTKTEASWVAAGVAPLRTLSESTVAAVVGGDATAPARRFIMAIETNAGPPPHPGFMSIFAL